MEFVTLENLTDEVFGKVGTEKRDAMERRLKVDVDSYMMGESLKKSGVDRSQVSRLERGISVNTSASIVLSGMESAGGR